MTQTFAFATATEILFGRGQAVQAAARIAGLGNRVLLVQGGNPARSDWLATALSGCEVTRFSVPREPDVALVQAGSIWRARQRCRWWSPLAAAP